MLSFNMKIYLELTKKRLFRLPRHLPKTENLVPAQNDQFPNLGGQALLWDFCTSINWIET